MEPVMTSEEAKKISALEHNIKQKGETSYYYAHKGRFEDQNTAGEAKTISGPGIITGGDPVLLESSVKKEITVIKEPKKITKYIFYDDDKFAVIKFDLPEDCKQITKDCVEANFQERSFNMKINVPNGDPYFFTITKLHQKIIPSESEYKLSKDKLTVLFRKKDEDEEWSKPSA